MSAAEAIGLPSCGLRPLKSKEHAEARVTYLPGAVLIDGFATLVRKCRLSAEADAVPDGRRLS